MSKKINILVIPSDLFGVGTYRFIEPHIELQKQFPEDFNVEINPTVDFKNVAYLKSFNIIFGNKDMCTSSVAEEVFPKLRENGTVVIMDIDDHWELHPKHPYYQYMKQSDYGQKIQNMLKLVDYVTTTTDYFATDIRKLNKNVTVFPNAVDPTSKKFKVEEIDSERVRIGWLGGSSHIGDLELLKPTFNSLNDKFKGQIQTVVCGFDTRGKVYDRDQNGQPVERAIQPKETCWYEYERIFSSDYKHLSPEYKEFLMKFKNEEYKGVENEQYRRVWTKPMSSYSLNYNLFDISLAPLEVNKFNLSKSPLKIIESGFFKKAVIASEITPYLEDIKHGVNGFLVNNKSNTKNWSYYATKLIKEAGLRQEMGESLYETVKDKYDIRNVSKARGEWYKSLIK